MGKNLARTSIGVTFFLVIGYLLSFVKEASIAKYFGISGDVDAYTIAIQMPVLIFSFVAVAIKSIIIPLYSEIFYNQGKEASNRFASIFISFNFFIALVIIILGFLFASPLTYLFAPGFDSDTHNLSVFLMRLTLPTIAFTVITDILIGVANVHKQYVLPSLAVYFLNLSIILCIIILHKKSGIESACLGQLIGGFLQMSYLFFIIRKKFQYHPIIDWKEPAIKKSFQMSLPVIWGISVAEVNAMVNRMVASMLFAGSIAAINYAGKLNNVFLTFFISAISTIVYPLYAEATAKKNFEQLSIRINSTLSVYSMLLIPLVFFIICFKRDIVEVAFARGAFETSAVNLTQGLLGCYSIGLIFMAFRGTITNVFYSMKDTKTVAKNATFGSILNIVLNITLPYFWGIYGLAIATSISAVFISVRLLIQLLKKYEKLNLTYFYQNLKKIIPASLVMFTIILVLRHIVEGLNCWAIFIGGAVISVIIYVIILWSLRTPILNTLLKMLKQY